MRAVAQALAPGLLELSLRDLVDEYAVALEVGGRSRRTTRSNLLGAGSE